MKNELKIEKNIPIPTKGDKGIFRLMKIGDSVFYKDETNSSKILNRASSNVRITNDYKHYKFVCRKLTDGVRLWRIK